MKSILYVGATLMIGASIYGFVDYKKNNHKKEFTRMYEMEKKETVPVKEKETTAKELSKEEPVVKEKISDINQKTESSVFKETREVDKVSKPEKKKLDYKLFSRAPLERKYITKEIKIEPAKKIVEPDKKDASVENKKQ